MKTNNSSVPEMLNEIVEDEIMKAMLEKIIEKGKSGDLKSLEWIINNLDLKIHGVPEESLKISRYSGIPGQYLGKAYVDIYRDIIERRHRFYDFKGGRGSLKSSFCALVMIDEIMRNPNFCGIALRQFKNTLEDSVYSQILWAIERLGVSEYFEASKNPMRIKKIDTGQIIYFSGCDKPSKLKSVKPPENMYIGVIWFEEKDQLKGLEAVRNIQQSLMRGGDDIIVMSSYNTPLSRRHFLNRTTQSSIQNNRIVHHSYYYDAPPEWLGQPFFDEAEYLKEINEKAYNHEYLGEAVGEGGSVFENININAAAVDCGRFYYGVDWGFYPDPWAFVKCCYSPKDRRLYITDEAMAYKKSNNDTAEILLKEKKLSKDDMIICDNSEPKSVNDYIKNGLYARKSEKGSGSVGYSMKWLQGLSEIIIDAKKCPNTAKEFLEYEYEKDSDGGIISSYPDKNNHFIDAVRYATNLLWRKTN